MPGKAAAAAADSVRRAESGLDSSRCSDTCVRTGLVSQGPLLRKLAGVPCATFCKHTVPEQR